ncbi:MAG TPA: ferric reductase-like transmembrane domain-containing protein [Verrucomicrobiae bacterium]|jgi:ferredoxin-NADP reductase/DMSO/TMAO reductase YedYZ heme-binding membrane subunit|nr:ferric reductase-like transmembrane domain-containing protein [Verrucomicrobiae bacterium]
MDASETRFAKLLVLVNAGVPAALLGWDALHHQLGANPVNFAILTTGMLALVFLVLTLLVTPLRKITGWNWLIFVRRTLGLYAFAYASLHFLIFFTLDRSFSIESTLNEMVRRKYLIIGSIGLLGMVPLAVTSTNAMIRRLGAKRWNGLHRLVYVVAIAGVIHYYMQVKADVRKPLAFAGVLTVLLGYRVVTSKRNTAPARAVPSASGVTTAATKPKLWSGELRVTRITQETPDVRTFRFIAPDGGRLPFEHQAGQYLVLSLLIDGKKVNRTYTISSPPTRSDYCEITVKREENGYVSRHLHEMVREGDTIRASAPAGRFIFERTQADSIVLIAGGVGITPLMSILRELTDRKWKGDIYFIYSAKTASDIIFRKELEDLRVRFSNVRVYITLSRCEDSDWTGHKGRVNGRYLGMCVPDIAKHPVYVCGPQAMMAPVIQLLRDAGVSSDKIKSEEFITAQRAETSPALGVQPLGCPENAVCETSPDSLKAGHQAQASPIPEDGEPLLTLARSGKSVALDPNKVLLEIAEDAGVNLDYECRSGVCGRCKTRLLSGQVTMETQDALTNEEKAKNIILMCQARAGRRVTVDA